MSVSSQFVLYSDIVPVDRDVFLGQSVQPPEDYIFAANVNSVPLTGFEFPMALRDYPIVFVGGEGGQYMPAVMLGVKSDENLFVSRKGQWLGKYIPMYVRQYPVMAAEMPDEDKVTICIDRSVVGKQNDEPLFDAQGKETSWLSTMSAIAAEYLAHMQKTMAFCRRLASMNLIVPLNPELNNTKTGNITRIEGLYAVEEQRLNGLSDSDAVNLFRNGDLAWIYLHLASLINFSDLANRKKS